MGLENTIRTQLETYLTMMVDPIEIHAHVDETDKSKEMMALLRELTEINAKISLKELQDNDTRVPSFGLSRQGEVPRVHFAGIPMGHEFTSLVLALLHVSGHAPKIEASTAEQIKSISGTYRFESFISLSCHNCPDVVQALNILAVLNPGFSHTMVDGAIFHDEASRRQVMAVPSIFLNDEMFGSGRMQIEEILAKLDTTASIDLAHALSEKEPFDVLVIGGGPSGASAAIYAARKGIRTGIVTEKFGGQVSETLGIENFISVSATEGPRLVASMEEHVKEYGVDIMRTQRAVSLEKEGDYFRVGLQNGASLKSKTMILSTGARWRELGVPGESEFKGKGVAYCPHCDGPVFKGKRIAVIGGGNSGVEAAIDLAGIVEHVTLLEFAPELKADAVLQNRLRSLQNVDILVHVQTSAVTGTDKVNGLSYVDRSTLEKHHIPLEGVFVQIGLMPNTDWLKGTLELNRFGEIVVNAHGATSMPGVFAAGDCTTVPFKQIIIAMGEGAKAALGAFDYLIRNA